MLWYDESKIMNTHKILMVGDIVGAAGRTIFQRHIENIKKDYDIDFVIVNGENSAHGVGITPRICEFFKNHGVDVITSGNHIWHKKEIFPYLSSHQDLLRPANFPAGVPGVGVSIVNKQGAAYAVVNLLGRVFMRENLDCPFRTLETILTYVRDKARIIIVDFHAEATSEKQAFATCFDGRVTAIIGTHTHVQTADERVMPGGTAYITDVGMAGAVNSLLGMEAKPIIQRFLTQMPVKFSVEMAPPYMLGAVVIEADASTGAAVSIKRLMITDNKTALEKESIEEMVGGW
jgi:metallophosphoesterase (TIGR00282 family)